MWSNGRIATLTGYSCLFEIIKNAGSIPNIWLVPEYCVGPIVDRPYRRLNHAPSRGSGAKDIDLNAIRPVGRSYGLEALSLGRTALPRGALDYGSFTAYSLNGVGSCPLFFPLR